MRKQLALFAAVAAFALPPICVSKAALAAELAPRARAVGDADPFVLTWVDTGDGKVSLDDGMAEQIHALFAGAEYIVASSSHFLLGHQERSDLKLALPPAHLVANETNTFFAVHVRSQDRTLFLDGAIRRFAEDPGRGFAQWTLTLIGNQGDTTSSLIQQDLVFPTSRAPVTGQPTTLTPLPASRQ